jgi:hypothetical protein
MQVGDKVYLKAVNNNARYDKEVRIEEYEIKKIGRKYFEVWEDNKEWTTVKFNVENKRQVTNYSPNWKLYFSKQEILDDEEKKSIERELSDVFRYSSSKLSLDQLRRIKTIIDENKHSKVDDPDPN